jgi:hypothetical protein
VTQSIPVICDRCREQGQSGEDPFAAFGALLDFEPVPRFSQRADGWDENVQRAYIAALSLTGSDRAVGKSAYGVKQLLAHEGSEGFRAAREEALAMAEDERGRRLAEGLRAVAKDQAGWRPPEPPWARAETRGAPPPPGSRRRGRPPRYMLSQPAPGDETDEERIAATLAFVQTIAARYWVKLQEERRARLAGRIVEADFCLRQITWLEVALDVGSGDGWKVFEGLRCGEYKLIDVAETPLSRLMDRQRRAHWAAAGDPPRPEHPPERYLRHHDGFSTEPNETTRGGRELSHAEQQRLFEERHAADAAAQIEWEAEARRDHERRREAAGDSPAAAGEEVKDDPPPPAPSSGADEP